MYCYICDMLNLVMLKLLRRIKENRLIGEVFSNDELILEVKEMV